VRASEPKCAGNKQGSYEIMRITMFAAQDMVKPDRENIRGLNLAAVKLTTIQVTKLLFYRNINKICMICSAEPGLTRGLVYSTKGTIFNIILYVHYAHLIEAKHIYEVLSESSRTRSKKEMLA
jgi:hypothetical protein